VGQETQKVKITQKALQKTLLRGSKLPRRSKATREPHPSPDRGLYIWNNVVLVETRNINVLYHLIHRRQVFALEDRIA
jgi:hypothetical protein